MHARWTITVPQTYNDGTPLPRGTVRDIERRVAAIAGGFTATPGEGVWRGEDRLYREPVTVYTFDVGYIADGDVRQLAEDVALLLDQEAVYVTRQDVETFLVEQPVPPLTVTA